MKYSIFKHLAILASAVITLGCAGNSSVKTTETMAVAAGFKAIKPTSAAQKKTLSKLPADKFTRISHAGKTYYVLPDRADGQAYVGGEKQYQDYIEDGQARAAVADYNDATSDRARESGIDSDNDLGADFGDGSEYRDLNTWAGWGGTEDWSATDGQTN